MTCELFVTQMYTQRPGDEAPLPQDFADHLRTCGACSQRFAHMVEQDASIRRTIQKVGASSTLEASILSGLALDRQASSISKRSQARSWRQWLWAPAAIAALVLVSFIAFERWQSHSLLQQASAWLLESPPLNIEGGERDQILRWSDQVEPGAGSLPNRLGRVQFVGASQVQVDNHAAVLFRMKHESRASLLVLDHSLPGSSGITSRSANQGSLAYWSEQDKTYVLIFHGDRDELQSYMLRMGIIA